MEAKPTSFPAEDMRRRVLDRLRTPNPAGVDDAAAMELGVDETRAARRERARKAG